MPAPTASGPPPRSKVRFRRGSGSGFGPRRGGGRGRGQAGVGASGKEEKGEAPRSCFLLSRRPSAPLPFTTSIFCRCSERVKCLRPLGAERRPDPHLPRGRSSTGQSRLPAAGLAFPPPSRGCHCLRFSPPTGRSPLLSPQTTKQRWFCQERVAQPWESEHTPVSQCPRLQNGAEQGCCGAGSPSGARRHLTQR